MRVQDYDTFVRRTDQFKDMTATERKAIALYGLVGEIGSLVSAAKKTLLSEAGEQGWDHAGEEIIEEIGDVLWYCFSLTQIENHPESPNIFVNDIAALAAEIGAEDARADTIRRTLNRENSLRFLGAAKSFSDIQDMTFQDYQSLAFLTARTSGVELFRVCLAVLSQLGAELLRKTLPDIELALNKNIADRPINTVVGEIVWHLSAITSLLDLTLDYIVKKNVEKVSFRSNRDTPTPLHDDRRSEAERLPRVFQIAFVSISATKSRMYYCGRRFGSELTDNAYNEDGYRFHDVFHLSNVAHLGWSPVVRKLMNKKRKSLDDKADEVEDGARAEIVEEAVLKAIHSEGVRLVQSKVRADSKGPIRTFSNSSTITFRLLKMLRTFVEGLEVWKNQYWEWDDAILEGAAAYYELRTEGQGTITVDMGARRLSYSPDVAIDLRGAPAGIGRGRVDVETLDLAASAVLSEAEAAFCQGNRSHIMKAIAAKRAILDSLGIEDKAAGCEQLMIKLLDQRQVCTKATGEVQNRMWFLGVISFKIAFSESEHGLDCTAIAIADLGDLS